ncbi:MAG: hypothetical protein RML93_06295 [Anaerolineales bacterium]|nr:hypothetical protein [Anaerolineales bacterium]MCS7247673.1 hypothetical protein [Anaerolineales bacterium]MDW8161483.1 hypothetical protein [Anaerolineales bacterium]MDW8446884.1 hypothetical protein [Anaerolineales bacterium]
MVGETASPSGLFWRVALFSAVALLFQVILTRLFSVAQFYHFVFLIVSIAMLGYAVSGVVLAFRPALSPQQALAVFERCALGGTISILAAYLILNELPFDSFSIAWDVRQLARFGLNYLALSLPFFFSGLALGVLLNAFPQQAGQIYAWNFIGAGVGCLGGLALPGLVGGEGVIVACCGALALCALPRPRSTLLPDHLSPLDPSQTRPLPSSAKSRGGTGGWVRIGAISLWVGFCVLELIARSQGTPLLPALNLRLSQYKSLSYALQYPDAELIFQRWNAFSRVDVVRSSGIRSVAGMSFTYAKPLPPQAGLFVDGDNLSPLLYLPADLEFTAYLPQAVAFWLQPHAHVLVLEPRGGMDILVALAQGAETVTAVEVNPLVVVAARQIYTHPGVNGLIEDQRSFTRRTEQRFDVILLTLTSSFHPVRSGAYSLAEDYRYTLESFSELLQLLQPQGVLVFNRWLQKPPSESLRAFATAVEALESLGLDPRSRIVVLRGYALATFLVKRQPFNEAELATVRQFARSRAFDLIYAPDLRPEETNRFNVLAESLYTSAYQAVLEPQTRQQFYRRYAYDVRPVTDDRPFFAHYFKWGQTRQALAEFGQTWQPFGGVGMLVVVGLFGFVLLLGALLVGLTGWLVKKGLASQQGSDRLALPARGSSHSPSGRVLFYFTAIGFAYLLVELALIQRFQLYLGQPAYAVAGVLFALLVSSGIGSLNAQRAPLRLSLFGLALWIATAAWWLKVVFERTLAFPLPARLALMFLIIAPGGLGMGVAFPAGLRFWLREEPQRRWLPLIWSLNGAASVIASVGAMLLALSFGFSAVLQSGALLYALAAVMVQAREPRAARPRR